MMLEMPIIPIIALLAVLHCVIGLAAAAIAQRKGCNRNQWLVWGLIGGTVALVMAVLIEEKT
jgi:steroid 5-alpha reductase family enzyme